MLESRLFAGRAGWASVEVVQGVKELGIRLWVRQSQRAYLWLPVIGLGFVLLLTSCSAGGSSGGTNITLGLAGSTADQPSSPPSVAGNGPDDTYAFVYDDQIWVRQSGNSTPVQITHLVLSNGADISFGPLVWSPDGKQIAFALLQNLTPTVPSRSAGPIYVVNVATKSTVVTPGIGSIYGHNYAWYGPRMLFYSSGDGISMYDIGDPDPRVWQVLSAVTSSDGVTFSDNDVAFGDIAITNESNDFTLPYLFFSAAQISTLGGTGAIGTAGLYEVQMPFTLGGPDGYNSVFNLDHSNPDTQIGIPEWLYLQFPLNVDWNNIQVADLGSAFSDTAGNSTMGSWQLSPDGSTLVSQVVDSVNTNAQTVSSNFCVSNFSNNYYGCQAVLTNAGTCPLSVHGQLSLSLDASHIAFTCDGLYMQGTQVGGSASKLASVGWTSPAAMTQNGQLAIATQIVSSSRDSNGVLRVQTNLVAFDGTNSYVLVKGAQSASWQ
ncbi:MAG: hypothetical protein ACLQUY_01975 [Ktedonobacterales bacterium]